MTETAQARIKRLTMRSWRRGIKEMDLILGPFADSELAGFGPDDLSRYDALLEENDHDLYMWVCGKVPAPAEHAELLRRIARFTAERRLHSI